MEQRRENLKCMAEDRTELAATFYEAGESGLIMLHQLRHERSSWHPLASLLQQQGWSCLAVDLRGHGESKGKLDAFNARDFQAMLFDARAAAAELRKRKRLVTAIIGASIGANTAFKFSSVEKVPALLLSPGLEYKGIDINDVTSTARTLIIAAEDDTYSASSSKELCESNLLGEQRLLIVPGDKHGTYLLEVPSVQKAILEFLGRLQMRA